MPVPVEMSTVGKPLAAGVNSGGLAFGVVILLAIAVSVVIWAMSGSVKRMNRNIATGRFQETSNVQAVRRMERARRNRLVQFLLRPPGSARQQGPSPRPGSAQASSGGADTYPEPRTPPPPG